MEKKQDNNTTESTVNTVHSYPVREHVLGMIHSVALIVVGLFAITQFASWQWDRAKEHVVIEHAARLRPGEAPAPLMLAVCEQFGLRTEVEREYGIPVQRRRN